MKTFFLVDYSSNVLWWEINMHIHSWICWTFITDNWFREYVCEAGLKGCRRTIANGKHAQKQMIHWAMRQNEKKKCKDLWARWSYRRISGCYIPACLSKVSLLYKKSCTLYTCTFTCTPFFNACMTILYIFSYRYRQPLVSINLPTIYKSTCLSYVNY